MTRTLKISLAAALSLAMGLTALAEPSKKAWVMRFDLDWKVASGLAEKAMLVSLQGLANREEAQLYIIHPADFQWEITEPLYDFYQRKHGVAFSEIPDAKAALKRFKSAAKGYVVWDKEVGPSLNVAFTIAGLEDAIVVSEELIPLMRKVGLKEIDDLRGRYTGQSDAEIYGDAIERYWHRCNRDKIMLMGGHRGRVMMPAMADWGIRERMFFHDLSADPNEADELVLNRQLLEDLNPGATVFGWHPYGKDTEEQSTMLLSLYGLKMEGLHNLPNLSYNCQFSFTPGFKFTNNHHVGLDETLVAEEKVYISFVQSDSIGIGVWTKPGRGKLPFAWQVTMNWTKFSPAALEYFHESATPNDYFIGGLSGPGYMYPNNIPKERFPQLMEEAKELMAVLDERVMEIMDNSAADGNVGNADLFKETVDAYYEAFPDVIGFINGYGPARTFDLRDTRPMLSYDYYIDPKRPREEVTADLNELIALNSKRPYFLLVHVRESNDVNSLVEVVENLEGPVEVKPLDVFLKLAASNKTYQTRFRQPDDPVHFKGY
ncbi:GxGYxYP family putative glycoside hydrolase [Pelagicoccus enzymogenes]|uniref:GxGYxYP domain-containing protein n=1 Tax=Pelagicoccus enzymogenes TaxID=2773457 RepID=UPI0028103D77|nr:GxGYxYP domain-containing protein [Pelagicoccus enzymogenes]MDQ8198026.1 GxGYxYP family putative glycoside hydrolase [Pelagicoccus enzymogenes]